MAFEIERKFLVVGDTWHGLAEPADCGSWFFSVEMPWSSFGKCGDRGMVLYHDIRVSAALVQNGLSYIVPEGVTRKRGLRPGSELPLMSEEDAWNFFWNQAHHASGMDVMWNTLTWVNEKGETVFDPSATGDEAECQRKVEPRGSDPIGGVGVVE